MMWRRTTAMIGIVALLAMGSAAAPADGSTPGGSARRWVPLSPRGAGPLGTTIRTWTTVDMYRATMPFPKGWVLIDYSADEPFPPDSPVMLQLTNYDPGVRRRPACVGGQSAQPPPDGVILSVGTGSLPELPPQDNVWGHCPVPVRTDQWSVNGRDYWDAVFARIDADPGPAYRALARLVIPPDGAQDSGVWAWKSEPVVILLGGEAPFGPWVLTSGAHTKDLSYGDPYGGGGGGPNSCPSHASWFGSGGWGSAGSGRRFTEMEGVVGSDVTRVSYVSKQGVHTRAIVRPVPESLYGGTCNVFGLVAELRMPSRPFHIGGKLVFRSDTRKLGQMAI